MKENDGLLDPEMPTQQLRLHMGELTASEVRVARAAIAWANTRSRPVGGDDRPAIPGLQEAVASDGELGQVAKSLAHAIVFGTGDGWQKAIGEAISFLSKLQAACQSGVPDGYVVVPIEPTEEMQNAAREDYYIMGGGEPEILSREIARDVYRAMISAARDGRD